MTAFQMSESLKIGHPQIDVEHTQLLVLLDRVADSLRSGNEVGCADIINELTRALENHIESEEEIMKGLGYPDLAEHRQAHLEAKIRFDALIENIATEGYAPDLPNDLIAILIEDLIMADLPLKEYLEKGADKG